MRQELLQFENKAVKSVDVVQVHAGTTNPVLSESIYGWHTNITDFGMNMCRYSEFLAQMPSVLSPSSELFQTAFNVFPHLYTSLTGSVVACVFLASGLNVSNPATPLMYKQVSFDFLKHSEFTGNLERD